MIEILDPMACDVETECVAKRWARLRVGTRKFGAGTIAALSIWQRGVMVAEFVEFYDEKREVNPLVDIVWKNLCHGFEIAKHNEKLAECEIDDLRHG